MKRKKQTNSSFSIIRSQKQILARGRYLGRVKVWKRQTWAIPSPQSSPRKCLHQNILGTCWELSSWMGSIYIKWREEFVSCEGKNTLLSLSGYFKHLCKSYWSKFVWELGFNLKILIWLLGSSKTPQYSLIKSVEPDFMHWPWKKTINVTQNTKKNWDEKQRFPDACMQGCIRDVSSSVASDSFWPHVL